MSSIIIDTSALVCLGRFAYEFKHQDFISDKFDAFRIYGGVDCALEALVLYDNIYVDAHSYYDRFSLTDPFSDSFDFFAALPITAKQRNDIHLNIATKLIESKAIEDDFFNKIYEDFYGGENYDKFHHYLTSFQYFDSDERAIQDAIGFKTYHLLCNEREKLPILMLVQIIRAFYYNELQKTFNCNLVLHPFKGLFVSTNTSLQSRFLSIFDQEVRKKREDITFKWINEKNLFFKFPILTKYILGQTKPGFGLAHVINKVRESKEAKYFREGINEVCIAIDNNDQVEIERVCLSLEKASIDWAKEIGLDPSKYLKKISISIPVYGGLGGDIKFNIPKAKLGTSDKILTFIHELLEDDVNNLKLMLFP
ncbi:hypothetical protein GCM10028808_40260 [Spirosoma migulaei]